MNNKLARVLSKVFEPILWVPVAIGLSIYKTQATYQEKIYTLIDLLFFVFLVPLIYFLYVVFINKKIDIDASEKEGRLKILAVTLVSFLSGVILVYFINKNIFTVTLAVYLASLTLTLTILLIIHFYGFKMSWLFFFLIPIFYARLKMKKHNFLQLIAGFVVSLSIFKIVTKIGGRYV